MIWKTAWKNVWRSRVRSFVVIASVTVGVFAAVFMIAFMNGMLAQRVDAALDEEISHIQVTGEGFRLNDDPHIFVPDPVTTLATIRSVNGIAGIVERITVTGMATTAAKSSGIVITGIDPLKEKQIFTLNKTIIPGTGDYFETESKYDPVLIGHDLAKELNIVRFIIDSASLGKLEAENVPARVIEKLATKKDIHFRNEKKFVREMKSLLSPRESAKYLREIKDAAWSFREGSRLNLTFLDINNNQVDARFRVTGIYDIKNSIFETGNVFVRIDDLRKLIGSEEGQIHQIIIRLDDIGRTGEVTNQLRKTLPGTETVNWKELQPDLAMMTDYVTQIYAIFMIIILAALAFGIVNTMLMAVLERTKELGMLTAIGMNRKKVFYMIMLESVFLSVIGGVSGMLIARLIITLTARNGINFIRYAEGMEAWGYSAHIYPQIGPGFFVMATVLVIITGILSAIYPAIKALKLNPVEAIRTE